MPNLSDAEELRRIAVKIARDAARFLAEQSETGTSLQLVSGETFKADIMAESLIIDELVVMGVGGTIVSEERGVEKLNDEPVVSIIDPLDGTINYVNNIPWCAVSIAFALKKGNRVTSNDIVAGVVYPVFYGEPISFATGKGIYLGETRIEPPLLDSNYERLGWKIVALYEDDPKAIESIRKIYDALVVHVRNRDDNASLKLRSLGSASMELAYVGLGKIGFFIDLRARLRIVDVAAGLGIIKEAGGLFTDAKGERIVLEADRVSRLESIIAVYRPSDIRPVLSALR